jgi:hypothetical protein
MELIRMVGKIYITLELDGWFADMREIGNRKDLFKLLSDDELSRIPCAFTAMASEELVRSELGKLNSGNLILRR